jgi:hypothetical protein
MRALIKRAAFRAYCHGVLPACVVRLAFSVFRLRDV